MPLTDREIAIAGFAWSAGNLGQSMETMDELLHAADLFGGFDADFLARSAAGECPSENDIRKRIFDTADAMRRGKT